MLFGHDKCQRIDEVDEMAIGGISTGINTGLPIGDLVTAMVNAEKAPKEAQLARLEKSTVTKFSALGELSGALNTFQAAMKDLNSAALFEKRTAISTNKEVLTATAGKTAAAGTYGVEVKNLATASKVATAVIAKDFTSGTADSTLQVRVGAEGTAVDVNIGKDSDLASIRDQINAQLKDQGITANIIQDPNTGDSRLVFSGNKTGSGNDIIVSSEDASLGKLTVDGSKQLSTDSAASAGFITQAKNAVFTIDGLELQSATNKVAGAISDVSFDLLAKTEVGKPLTLTVGQDTAGVKGNIKKFVDAYNSLINTSSKLTNVTKAGEDGAPVVGGLVGDATVRSLLSGVRNELVNPAGDEGIRVLADMGITTQKDGTLKIDDTKFDTVMAENFDSLTTFFTGDKGLMSRVTDKIGAYTQTGGIIEQRQKALDATRTDIKKQTENLNLRVEKMQTRLLAQFNAMESLVGKLNGTSSQLESALGNLPGVVRNKK